MLGSGSDAFKYWDERRAGRLSDQAWQEMEAGIARSAGTCMTMGTAATMMGIAEAVGLALPGASSIPAADANHVRMSAECGRRAVEMAWEDLTPAKLLSRESFLNGIACAMAMGCSTNAIIHLIAMSRRAGHPITLDDFDAFSRRVPVLANIRPSGDRWLMEDFFYAGGLPALLQRHGVAVPGLRIAQLRRHTRRLAVPRHRNRTIGPRRGYRLSRRFRNRCGRSWHSAWLGAARIRRRRHRQSHLGCNPPLRHRPDRRTAPDRGPVTGHRARLRPGTDRHARRPGRRRIPRRRRLACPRNPVHEDFPLMTTIAMPGKAADKHAVSSHGPLRVGIGGPVGSGKTTLTAALCKAFRDRYDICAITNDIYTKEDARILTAAGALPERALVHGTSAHSTPRGRRRDSSSERWYPLADEPRRPYHVPRSRARRSRRRDRDGQFIRICQAESIGHGEQHRMPANAQ